MKRAIPIVIAWALLMIGGKLLSDFRTRHGLAASPGETESLKLGDVQSVAAQSFWELRKSLAIITWNEAQTYFHNGFDLAAFSRNENEEQKVLERERTSGVQELPGSVDQTTTPSSVSTAPHDHDDHANSGHQTADAAKHASPDDGHQHEGVEAHGESDQLKIKSMDTHPFLQQSPLRPYIFTHVESEDGARKMMPFYWLTVQLDPTYIRAYTGAAWWLAFRFKKTKEAFEFLDKGIQANPDSYELYTTRGHIHFTIMNDHAAAQEDFRRACDLNPHRTQYQIEEGTDNFRYLAWTHLRLHENLQAIEAAHEARRLTPDAAGTGSIITDATLDLIMDLEGTPHVH